MIDELLVNTAATITPVSVTFTVIFSPATGMLEHVNVRLLAPFPVTAQLLLLVPV